MTTSRRDLLKFFAAGTVITPAAGGALAQLIEPPKARIITPETAIVQPFRVNDLLRVESIEFKMRDGSTRRFHPNFNLFDRCTDGEKFIEPIVTVSIGYEHRMSPSWVETVASVTAGGRIS